MQIRVAEEKDAAALVEIYSYYVEKTAITFEYETPSTEEFAERIGVSTITISRIENGTTRIDVQLLMNMAEVLQTKVTTILGTEEDEFIEAKIKDGV